MKVLIISSNYLPASPSGPAYVAGAARQAGHMVEVYESLFATNLKDELAARLVDFRPDVVGISIRLVFGDSMDPGAKWGTRHTDLRPRVREIVDTVRGVCPARIVLGGPGFNYFATDWLNYLDVDYGIRGEAEESFPLFLQRLSEGGDIESIPGCVVRKDGYFKKVDPLPVLSWDEVALPAYDLFDMEKYAAYPITPAIFTKRGCVYRCSYCPYGKLEGRTYRLKSPQRVVAEIRHILGHTSGRRVMFCDNNFNAPRHHAEQLCREFIKEKLDFQWGTGDMKPVGITRDFCDLITESGCFYANLAIESASDRMLRGMKRGYTARHVRQSLDLFSQFQIPFGVSIMLGAPGEDPGTISETLRVLDDYLIPMGVWVTLGIYLWTDYQDIVVEQRRAGYLNPNKDLFNGAVYLSPDLSEAYLVELMSSLRSRPGYAVQFNQVGPEAGVGVPV